MTRKNFLFLVVIIICILLLANIVLTYFNNQAIKNNKALHEEIQTIRVYYDQIGKSVIHSLDIGLRGYAIVRNDQFSAPMDHAKIWKDSIVDQVEQPLNRLEYNMDSFLILKDSLNHYVAYCFLMKDFLTKNDSFAFHELFKTDKGAHLWWQYETLEKNINRFLNRLDRESQFKFQAALARNQAIQIILFLICLPTLVYTAYFTRKTFSLSEQLRHTEMEKNKILTDQNLILERKVAERTQEIATQNEEIISQSEELAAHRDILALQNKQLSEAHHVIEEQNQAIQVKNQQLQIDVSDRTLELQKANEELIEYSNQLEQFSFIAAHNLRAPLARILGLANVLEFESIPQERDILLEKLIFSTQELDGVVRDLNSILNIKRRSGNLQVVHLPTALEKAKSTLEKESADTNAILRTDFRQADNVYAIEMYVESILINLISNAIKYRHPDRQPVIQIQTFVDDDYVCLVVSDNGLGINLQQHYSKMFNLYKRFHLHMEGKGLGLYLIKTQVVALGGRIEVKSEPDKGSSFYVYFKRKG